MNKYTYKIQYDITMTIHNFRWCIFERKKIMELELKHLAPYLPYGLKILNGWGDIKTLNYTHLDDEGNGFIGQVKPILRPMSDLGKLNIIEGNHITPIVEIFNVRFASGAYDIIEVITDNDKCTLKVAWDKAISSISSFSFVANDNSFVLHDGSKQQRVGHQLEMFQKLFEYHFDVFGLIPAGLAIVYINQIKTPPI